jgi:penicillin-binding protein 1A
MTANADLATLAQSQKYAHIEAVHIMNPSIVGTDPYNSEQPILRARPVNEDGSPIRRAVPIGPDESEAEDQPVLKLKPPPGLKIEF